MRARRTDAAAQQGEASALALRDHFLRRVPLPSGGIAAGYIAHDGEMDPMPVMESLRARGFGLALPCVAARGQPLAFRLYRPGDALVSGARGLMEPEPDADEAEPDLILVPIVAFDACGYRLGRGGGHYDRTLAALRANKPVLAVGLAFSCQNVPDLPRAAHDARLDWIVTETAVVSGH